MRDELDPDLRRLFAATEEAPADETFVAGVVKRTSRERRILMIGRIVALSVCAAVLALALALAFGLVVSQSAGALLPVLTAGPIGWFASLALALAGYVCVRSLRPLFRAARL